VILYLENMNPILGYLGIHALYHFKVLSFSCLFF
jgi:hypothetical protein